MFSVFISHSSNDASLVESLTPAAEAAGVSLYLAEHDPRPGVLLAAKVRQAIKESDVVVVLITPNSFNSAYLHQEIGSALQADKFVIPIVERTVPRESLAMLDGIEYVHLDLEHPEECAETVRDVLEKEVARRQEIQAEAQAQAQVQLLVVAAVLALVVIGLSKPN